MRSSVVGGTVRPIRPTSQINPSTGDIRSTFGRVPSDPAGEGVRRVAMGGQRFVPSSVEANPRSRVGVLVNALHCTPLLARGHASGTRDARARAGRPAIQVASTSRSGASADASPPARRFSPVRKSRPGEVEKHLTGSPATRPSRPSRSIDTPGADRRASYCRLCPEIRSCLVRSRRQPHRRWPQASGFPGAPPRQ
jgi:hypothetical protein